MISVSKKFIFIHIPKTAGNAVQNILKNYSDDILFTGTSPRLQEGIIDYLEVSNPLIPGLTKHSSLGFHYSNWNTPALGDIDHYFKCATIRNPWDRAISFYFWKGFKTFDKKVFIENLKLPPMYDFLHYGKHNLNKVDYIMRYENLEEDFKHLCHNLNIKNKGLPVANKSSQKKLPYTEYYDDETQALVGVKYHKDIDHFGYTFTNEPS